LAHYIKSLISQGEHDKLDFKFEISDARKIARTFAAFANTHGGTLLIGVKDNGVIKGVTTDEEIYMAQAAAELYCEPKVPYQSQNWQVDGKWVLEIQIPKSPNAPHLAPWKNGKNMSFIRIDDENHLANAIIHKVLKIKNNPEKGVTIKYQREEAWLLDFLSQHEWVSLDTFISHAKTTRYKAEKILVNLIASGILTYGLIDEEFIYKLA